MSFKRIFIEKKKDYNVEEKSILNEVRSYLKIDSLEGVRILNVYDLVGLSDEESSLLVDKVLYEPSLDDKYEDKIEISEDEKYFRIEMLKGQFNQREESLREIASYVIENENFDLGHSKIFVFKGINDLELDKIKKYYINPLESSELDLEELSLRKNYRSEDILKVDGFLSLIESDIEEFKEEYGIGLDIEDILFCQDYFKNVEKRQPSLIELKLIDTYWSDHCRHTTFMTEITDIKLTENYYEKLFQESLDSYLKSRDFVYGENKKVVSLMDLATINMKETKKKGLLDDKEDSKEINAASIVIDVDVDGVDEKYLLMFKNETHNHPTEMEPFGGAGTCLGGAIRDPLSGRAYVYQAMRITGSADPRESVEDTLAGKLPQRKITRTAMEGYSSYGYEIGAATGFVREIYDEGYKAKRMEVGALVATAPVENVYRGAAEPGDSVILIGGRTGKDGVGGAVGSSKKHTEESFDNSAAEVQKGNAAVERKIVRLFRRPEASKLIKICNDFGAGGVSVAIGELADGLDIDLNKVPLKNQSLNGLEIALSESQERMAAVVGPENVEEFLKYCREEDVEATIVARVTEEKVLKMNYDGHSLVHINRDFLDSNGIRKQNKIEVVYPKKKDYFNQSEDLEDSEVMDRLKLNLMDLNIASQKGLIQNFDSTVGGETVLMNLGGKNQLTPAEGMVSRIPVETGQTKTCSMMSYGFDPSISKWSPYHGGYYAVVESLAKIVAIGGDVEKTRLSFQEYFERIDKDPKKWSKPLLSLLGAYRVQKAFDTPAIGGKDSMSGTFEDLNVPPTLISFAVNYDKVDSIISPEFKNFASEVGVFIFPIGEDGTLDLDELRKTYGYIKKLIDEKIIISASSVKNGGIGRSISEMALGNGIGISLNGSRKDLFNPMYGSIVVELNRGFDKSHIDCKYYESLGKTEGSQIKVAGQTIDLEKLELIYTKVQEEVFPIVKPVEFESKKDYKLSSQLKYKEKVENVRVFIPIFKGTYGEYNLEKAFTKLGAEVESYVFETLDKSKREESYKKLANHIENCHILALPDGMVMGSEPESGSKYTKLIFENPIVKKAVENHIEDKKLILGIGNGFESLIKLGLIEYGKYVDGSEQNLLITNNKEAGFISEMVRVNLKSNLSPFLAGGKFNEDYIQPLGSKSGRIVGDNLDRLFENGQVATVFKDNLTGSEYGIESLSSPNGLIYGTITGIDRVSDDLYKNVGQNVLEIFKNAVDYFK